LTAVVTATSAHTVTLGFSGTATAHANANDLSNISLTFLTPAFTNVVASSVNGTTNSGISIDFIDVGQVTYAGSFTETAANGGAVSGSRTATLTAETYTASVTTGTTFTSGVHYTIGNLPAGLTAVMTKTSATVATLTLTGSASSNANVNDVSNLTITWLDGAFTTTPTASNLAGYTDNTGIIDFNDQPSITYSGSFAETAANNGAVSGSIIAILTGDTYAATLTEGVHYSLANVPAGLSAVMTRTSPTVATLTFTGNAVTHANANDVANLQVTWQNGAFTTTTVASNVTGYTDNTGIIDFVDPGTGSLSYDTGTFTESVANDGTIGNSIVITLAGDTYAASLTLGGNVTVTNVPAGLTASITRTSATVATLTLTGTAAAHANANDIANLTVAFTNAAFATLPALNVTNSTKSNVVVDFNDPATGALAYDAGTLTESSALDGSIGNSLNLTLTGDTFAATLTPGVNVTFTNVPAGLAASITRVDATHASITLTGSATSHANANDIANLTVVFADAAFTSIPASLITNSTKSNIAVDFGDASITYTGAGFTEAASNNGTVTGSIVATLAGDTYTSSVAVGSTFTSGTHYTLTNVPAGLTATVTKTSTTVATITLTGTATTPTNVNDVASINITWTNAAFNTVSATNIAGSTGVTGLGVDFFDVDLTYGGTSFPEALTNDGSITTTQTITLTGDTFVIPLGNLTSGVHYTTANVPAGLTANIAVTSANTATLSFTGNATSHANANDVSNVTVTFLTPAFSNVTATSVTNYSNAALSVDFNDQPSIVYAGNFTEAAANNGSVSGSRTSTITGDSFTALVGIGSTFTASTHYTVANVPAGLTAVMTKTSANVATLTLTGSATAHLNVNDVANLTITWLNGAFINTTASNVSGNTDASGVIDFANQPSIIYSGSFAETIADTGSLVGSSRVATLTGDTFVNAGSTLTLGTHYTLTNVPAGLTPVMTVNGGGTTATLTFTGNATAHNNSNDVANLTITFLNGAFTNTTLASNVTGSSDANGVIDFIQAGTASITYDTTTFTEGALNNGSIGNVLTATLAGDTYASSLTVGGNVLVSNVPAGLTATITRVSGTVATIALSGNATVHASANDIANLTVAFQDSAFSVLPASNVTNATVSTLVVDFADVTTAALSYSVGTFSEAIANNGSIGNSSVVTITGGGTFGATLTAGVDVLFSNVPAGLTATITRNTSTTATIALTGSATAHANANDTANFTAVFQDSAFSGVLATNTTNSTKSDFVVDFADPTSTPFLNYSTATFVEAAANNGSSTTSITGTLSGDTFTGTVSNGSTFTSGTHYAVSNLPAGLTMVITKTSSTVATITLTGTATSHANANDVANLTIVWANAAFTGGAASSITNYNKADFAVDFNDPTGSAGTISSDVATLNEVGANNGTITAVATLTLASDTFTSSSGVMTSGTHYIASNVPAGMTLVITRTSSTTATVALTGTATAHANANDATLQIAFLGAAFTSGLAATGGSPLSIALDFVDTVVSGTLTYSSSTFTERALNDGGISNTLIATLSGETFAVTNANLTSGTHFTATNVPAGLTAVINVDALGTTAVLSCGYRQNTNEWRTRW
jgi:hypothetical protein